MESVQSYYRPPTVFSCLPSIDWGIRAVSKLQYPAGCKHLQFMEGVEEESFFLSLLTLSHTLEFGACIDQYTSAWKIPFEFDCFVLRT